MQNIVYTSSNAADCRPRVQAFNENRIKIEELENNRLLNLMQEDDPTIEDNPIDYNSIKKNAKVEVKKSKWADYTSD